MSGAPFIGGDPGLGGGPGLGGDPFGGATGFGFAVPQGDPGAVASAAVTGRTLGQGVGHQAVALRGAARTALGADGGWQGSAASAYAGYTAKVSAAGDTVAEGCRTAAGALQSFAHALEHAQSVTRAALRECEHQQSELTRQQKVADTAGREIQAAGASAGAAVHPAVAQTFQRRADQAQQQQQAAQRAALAAQRALSAAKQRGQRAFHDYQQAARTATAQLQTAASEMHVAPAIAGGPPVPVSVTPQDVRLAKEMLAGAGGLPAAAKALSDPRLLRGLGCGQLSPGAILQFLSDVQRGLFFAKLHAEDQPLDGSVGGVIPGAPGQILQGAWNTTAGTAKLLAAGLTHPGKVPGALERYLEQAAEHPGAFAKGLIDYNDFAHGRIAKGVGTVGAGIVEAKGAGKLAGPAGEALRGPDGRSAGAQVLAKLASSRGVPVVGDIDQLLGEVAKYSHPDNAAARAAELQRIKGIASELTGGRQITQQIIRAVSQLPPQVEVRVVPRHIEPPRPPAVNPRVPLRPRGAPRGR